MMVSAVCLTAGLALLALSWGLDRMADQAFRDWLTVAYRPAGGIYSGASARKKVLAKRGSYFHQSCAYDRWASGAALLAIIFLIIPVVCGLAIL